MKRAVSLILCLILASLCVFTASAAVDFTVTCTPSSDSVDIGDEIEVMVSVSEIAALKSVGLSFSYPDSLELVTGGWLLDRATLSNVDKENNFAALAFQYAETVSGDVFRLILKAKSATDSAAVTVKVKYEDEQGVYTEQSGVSAGITVSQQNAASPVRFSDDVGETGNYTADVMFINPADGIRYYFDEIGSDSDSYAGVSSAASDLGDSFKAYELYGMKDGERVGLDGATKVAFKLPKGYSSASEVYFVTEDGAAQKVDTQLNDAGEYLVGEISEFGQYVIVKGDDVELGDLTDIAKDKLGSESKSGSTRTVILIVVIVLVVAAAAVAALMASKRGKNHDEKAE